MIREYLFAITCLFIAFHCNTGLAQTVFGKLGSEPTTSMIVPNSPTAEDEISFMLAADGVTHSNACVQLSALGGNEFTISVDQVTGIIEIGLTGTHSGVCLANYDPVNGLQGSIGPLAARTWEIRSSVGRGPGQAPEVISFRVFPAPSVFGKLGSEPTTAMIVTDSPTSQDEISFMLAADGVTHSNACAQLSALGGAEFSISVDEGSRIIDIGVTGTPFGGCLADYVPTNGLQGSIGRLAAGPWEIRSSLGRGPGEDLEIIPFTVSASVLLGDVNFDEAVTFADIPPFIALLRSGVFQAEADTDGSGAVGFADIPPFIAILLQQ